MSKAYFLGMLHDGTQTRYTYRIAQKSEPSVQDLAQMVRDLGGNAWVYREGSNRRVFVVEFSKSFLSGFEVSSIQDKIDYTRGYFDAEGSVPLNGSRFYAYFCQKDRTDLAEVRQYLEQLGISCGKIHNPSERIDPNYWRFFVRAKSYSDFARIIGSRHPAKRKVLEMVI